MITQLSAGAAIDFVLPPDREAHDPPEARGLARDEVRLLVSDRLTDRIVHATFRDLPWFLDSGDLIVVNDSATLPARLDATLDDRAGMLHLSTHLHGTTWVVEPRRTAVTPGTVLSLPDRGSVRLVRPHHGERLWVGELTLPEPALDYLQRWGRPIRYDYVPRDWPIEAYQTVYARRPGSAEMPSAGRPFSDRVLAALDARGVAVVPVTLHTGVASLEADEPPYEEWFDVPERTAHAVRQARARGSRVLAVGTTVVRALESAVSGGEVRAALGWTDLVITAARSIRSATALLTGFHEPRASHLQMLTALADPAHVSRAYESALEQRYLWHEFGDVHLIV
jgi:S-adenosylmethionine:tRNA ribosyltransferase-isomerase